LLRRSPAGGRDADVIYDAVVLGAGPAGATAATLLARAGWSVAIVEKRAFPRRKVCGEFVSATSLPLLQDLGVAEDFLDLAGPEVRRVAVFAGRRTLSAAMPWAENAAGAWGRALARERLDGLLLDAAARAGARVWQPWNTVAVQRAPSGRLCTIVAGTRRAQLAARVVIAACGSWERAPPPLRIDRAHRPSDLLAFKAHFDDCDLPTGLMPLLLFPGGYGGMVRCDQGRVSLSCCIRRDALQRLRRTAGSPAGQAVLQHIRAHAAGVDDCLRRATLRHGWLSAGPIRPGIRRRFPQGILAVGNLAGEAHPLVAEGISMAMQSAWLLCRSLLTGQDDIAVRGGLDRIAREYDAAWRAAFAGRIRAAAVFAHLAQQPLAVAAVLHALERFPDLLTFGARLSGKANQIVPTPQDG
jgi:flavin-dependent dehydrogenase